MAGLDKDTPIPTGVILHQRSRVLELQYGGNTADADGVAVAGEAQQAYQAYRVPFELLRVSSPSAEVQGHGPGQETLQTGKREVTLSAIEPVGHYAIRLTFSDGHDTGIYSWDYLYKLATQQDELWRAYLSRLEAAGLDRDAPMRGSSKPGHSCGAGI